jgi:hypothetical protein
MKLTNLQKQATAHQRKLFKQTEKKPRSAGTSEVAEYARLWTLEKDSTKRTHAASAHKAAQQAAEKRIKGVEAKNHHNGINPSAITVCHPSLSQHYGNHNTDTYPGR